MERKINNFEMFLWDKLVSYIKNDRCDYVTQTDEDICMICMSDKKDI